MAHRTAEDVSGKPDRPLERDLPRPGAGRDLRGRLAELPSAHPSAADHGTDRRPPSEGSPARREALATGELERIGPGVVDERASRFQPRERRLADFLAGEGRSVVAIHVHRQQQAAAAILAAIKADGRLRLSISTTCSTCLI